MNPFKSKVVKEIGENGCLRYVKFKLPEVGEPNFYRMTNTFNSFFFSGKYHKNKTKNIFYTVASEAELDGATIFYQYQYGVPIVEVSDIYEFFHLVGYDRTLHKWIQQVEGESIDTITTILPK